MITLLMFYNQSYPEYYETSFYSCYAHTHKCSQQNCDDIAVPVQLPIAASQYVVFCA